MTATPAVDSLSSIGIVVGLVALSAVVAGLVASAYRLYLRERIQTGLATLVSLAVVALYLNVKSALGQVAAGITDPLSMEAVLFNGGTLVAAALVVPVASRVGDRLALRVTHAGDGVADVDLGRLVRSGGRVITVELPENIDTVEGYAPVPEEVLTALAGRRLVFPRGLTVGALEERIRDRLREDHGVGYVDVEVEPDGTVTHLSVGGRRRGIGPTLAPGTAAVAVEADPPFAASPGDAVQLWTSGTDPERVVSGELRATAGDTVTLALDAHDAEPVAGGTYRLVTTPAMPRPEQEFGRVLRTADETLAAIPVEADGPLSGLAVGALKPTVLAVAPADGSVALVPERRRRLRPGDVLYIVANPQGVRRLETAAGGARAESS
jgi:hypothetical protein